VYRKVPRLIGDIVSIVAPAKNVHVVIHELGRVSVSRTGLNP
jgi:hypothetical protein